MSQSPDWKVVPQAEGGVLLFFFRLLMVEVADQLPDALCGYSVELVSQQAFGLFQTKGYLLLAG
jgi:hypothetical protein